jgi:hypothetical protein
MPHAAHFLHAFNLAVIRLNLALQFEQQRLSFAINRLACGYFYPAFAHAIFLHIGSFFIVETNSDIVLEDIGMVVRAARIDRKMIG